jgi:hypothetical protein
MLKESGTASLGKFVIIGGGGIVFLFVIVLSLNYFNIISLQDLLYPGNFFKKEASREARVKDREEIIAWAGEEAIYQADLEMELYSYPSTNQEEASKLLLVKIVKDSIILQAGSDEGWIKLDSSVFNSIKKDYMKRIGLVREVRRIFDNRQTGIKGNIISIWFNNIYPGAVGYERGKEVALGKITSLQNRVKNKAITIQEAAQEIIDDEGLAQVDSSYVSNAILDFKAGPDEQISFDPVFDDLIRELSEGEVSDVYLAKDEVGEGGVKVDAVYMFAQVNEKEDKGIGLGFDEWYSQKEKKYEVSYN